jgi:hypothetical protein
MSMNESPPLFELEKWDAKLIHKLAQIGFFQRFGYTPPNDDSAEVYSDVITVPFYSGTQSEMEKVDKKLLKLVEHIHPNLQIEDEMRLALNSAVGEAAMNTREHAYKEDHKFKYPHVGLWWATGAASARERKIVVSLYDQGITIPVSYTKLPIFQSIKSILNLLNTDPRSFYANDAKFMVKLVEIRVA